MTINSGTPVLITTTTGTGEEARKIAHLLVEKKLVACVNIVGPINSVYSWQGKIVDDTEYKLFIKSFQNKWEEIKTAIRQNHSYSVPEISMIRIEDMQPDYLAWMKEVIN